MGDGEDEDENPYTPPWVGKNAWPGGVGDLKMVWAIFWWAFKLPLYAFFALCIPDCRKDEKKHLYLASFGLSIAVIAFLSFWMVWWVTEVCDTAGLPVEV